MTEATFTLSKSAAVRGGASAGQYLQSIGETDLAKLSVPQFEMFCSKFMAGTLSAALDDYMTALEREPPF